MNERLYKEGEILKKSQTIKSDGNCNLIVVDDPDWDREDENGNYKKARKVRSKCSNFTPKKKKRK